MRSNNDFVITGLPGVKRAKSLIFFKYNLSCKELECNDPDNDFQLFLLIALVRTQLKEVAIEKGWTQTKLQRAADVHAKTMSGIFHNPYRDISYSMLTKIAKVLEVEISALAEEVSEERKQEENKGV